jgi:hypothetical protein
VDIDVREPLVSFVSGYAAVKLSSRKVVDDVARFESEASQCGPVANVTFYELYAAVGGGVHIENGNVLAA